MSTEKLEAKIDKIMDRISSIDATLAKQEVTLAYHIKRTDLLEKQVEPVQKHTNELKGIVTMLKILALLATIIEGIHYIKGL